MIKWEESCSLVPGIGDLSACDDTLKYLQNRFAVFMAYCFAIKIQIDAYLDVFLQ